LWADGGRKMEVGRWKKRKKWDCGRTEVGKWR
jgi:hypothetical protein